MSGTGAVVAPRSGRRKRDSREPVLLRYPRNLDVARHDWQPVLLRRRRPDTVVLLIAFLAAQFLIPARMVIGGMGAVGRPSVALGLLLVFLWLMSVFRSGQLPSGSQPIRWVVGIWVAIELAGYAVGYDRGLPVVEASAADRWLIFVLATAGIALATADGIATRKQLDTVLKALIGFTAVMAAIGALQFLRIVDLVQYIKLPGLSLNSDLIGIGARGGPEFARVASTANHYIEFGVVLALVLPIALHYAMFARPGSQRRWLWVAVGLIAAGIPFAISRSATLAVIMGLGLMATVWPWRQRYNALILGVVATAAFHVMQPGVLGTIRALFTNAEDDPSVQDRIARTDYVMNLWELRPWFGRGAGTVIPSEYILLDNQIYMTLLAGGVLGVTGLAIFFLAPYFVGRSLRLRGADQETRHLAQSLAVAMPVGLMVSATFDSFSFATFVGVVAIVMGAIGALWRLDHQSPHERVLQVAAPGDKYVATPWMARWRPGRAAPVSDHSR